MSPGNFEGMFIKAGDSDTNKGLTQKQQQESPGWAVLAQWEVREKEALGTGSGGQPGTRCCCPLFGGCKSHKVPQNLGQGCQTHVTGDHSCLMVALKGPNIILGLYKCNYFLTRGKELCTAAGQKQGAGPDKTRWRAGFGPQALCLPPVFQQMQAFGGKRRERQRCGCAPRKYGTGSFVLRGFISHTGGNFRGSLKGCFQQNIHQFSRCALSGSWSPLIGQCQGMGHQSQQLVLALPTWFCCFSGPGDDTQLRPGCYLQGGNLLYLPVNFLANLFSCLNFPYSTCQGIFPASQYPASNECQL